MVTKKTVFKWQEGFWVIMKQVFDAFYKEKYIQAGKKFCLPLIRSSWRLRCNDVRLNS